MDQYQENLFLDNEANFLKKYQEDEIKETQEVLDQLPYADGAVSDAAATTFGTQEAKVFESFIKEKHIILNYIYELILFAAKTDGIKLEDIFVTEAYKRRA